MHKNKPEFKASPSLPDDLYLFVVYLNDVATEGPPETLLFRIVELIIGEVPGILDFRLRHILS